MSELVVWLLARGESRNPTPAMKRGEASRLWLLMLVPPAVGVLAVWAGNIDLARVCAALTVSVPFLFLKAEFWRRDV